MPDIPIYAFEPNPNLTSKLRAQYSNLNVKIFPVALGEVQQKLTLNISEFSPSSSLLEGSEKLYSEFPETAFKEAIEAQVDRLDNVVQQNSFEKNFLLKIDVQSFEMSVLKGAVRVIEKILVIVCEVSFASLYEQQCAFEEITSFLRKYNFDLVDIGNPIRSRQTQKVLYVDLAFMKR